MTFVEILNAAKDTRDAVEYVARVKSAVSSELATLDSSAVIEDTSYFNHSAIPDLVLKWPKENSSRAVFLRHSYQSVVDADDVDYLAAEEPVFMSLDTRERDDRRAEQRLDEVAGSTRILMTDPSAVDIISVEAAAASPLNDLVRANFIRGGRGLIDEPRAASLVESATPAGSPSERTELISQSFSEAAAARITRTAQLIELALADEFLLPDLELSPLVGGKLSIAELRHLVPWLLRQERAVSNRGFWEHLGEYVTFAELENIRVDLADLDLSPLIIANADRWSARRAYIGLAVPIEGDDTYAERSNYWSFRGGAALGIDVGEQRLSVADDGRLLKPRESSSAATWDRIKDAVAGDRLSRIDLRGITRSVILTAERSPDIRSDIQQVTESLGDSYTVSELAIRAAAPGREGAVDIEVDFDSGLATAPAGASISDLARVSLQVLNYRAPISNEDLGVVLAPPAPND